MLLLQTQFLRTRHLAPCLAWHPGRARARPPQDATNSRSLRRPLEEGFCSRHLVRYAACGPESLEIMRTNQVQLQAKIAVNEWLRLTARLVLRFRSSPDNCSTLSANFGNKGALATPCFWCGFEFEVPERAGGDCCRNFKFAAPAAGPAGSRWPTAPPPSIDCGAPRRARSPRRSRGRARARRG